MLVLLPRLLQVSVVKEVHWFARLKVVLGEVTVAFLLKVTSAAKLAVPPLKVPMISINTPFLQLVALTVKYWKLVQNQLDPE